MSSSATSWAGRDLHVLPVCEEPTLTQKPHDQWPPPAEIEISPPYEDFLGRPSYYYSANRFNNGSQTLARRHLMLPVGRSSRYAFFGDEGLGE